VSCVLHWISHILGRIQDNMLEALSNESKLFVSGFVGIIGPQYLLEYSQIYMDFLGFKVCFVFDILLEVFEFNKRTQRKIQKIFRK